MSLEIWKIGQEKSAQQVYNSCDTEVIAAKTLTKICNDMNIAYDEIIKDQNEYLLEIEAKDLELANFAAKTKNEEDSLLDDIKKLEQKEQDGTITEDEQKELDTKRGKLNPLIEKSSSEINSKSRALSTESKGRLEELTSKENIARNYGEVAVEKGTPLANTHVSSGFFKKLFGCTGADKKEAGEEVLEAGNNLLDKVNNTADVVGQIKEHTQNIAKTHA